MQTSSRALGALILALCTAFALSACAPAGSGSSNAHPVHRTARKSVTTKGKKIKQSSKPTSSARSGSAIFGANCTSTVTCEADGDCAQGQSCLRAADGSGLFCFSQRQKVACKLSAQ